MKWNSTINSEPESPKDPLLDLFMDIIASFDEEECSQLETNFTTEKCAEKVLDKTFNSDEWPAIQKFLTQEFKKAHRQNQSRNGSSLKNTCKLIDPTTAATN